MNGNQLPSDSKFSMAEGMGLRAVPPTPPPLPDRVAAPQANTAPSVSKASKPIGPVPVARPIPIERPTDPAKVFDAARRNERAVPDAEGGEVWKNERVMHAMPPWFVSLFTHMLLLIILGLIFFPGRTRSTLQLEATFADSIGEQLDEAVTMSQLDSMESEQAMVLDEVVLPPVENPLASMPPLDLVPDPVATTPDSAMPSVTVALNGREVGMRQSLLKAYGGTKETEAAVKNALQWLWRQQRRTGNPKGYWSLEGPYKNAGEYENRVAATAMALLAFQGAGHTHYQGQYKKEIKLAWDWLLKMQKANGSFYNRTLAPNDRYYTHAMATIALCELLAMTNDSRLLGPAERAISFLISTQSDGGGWRYQPYGASDLSVTGWCVMALQSARMAGITVPAKTMDRVGGFLDEAAVGYGDRYGYMVETVATKSMTAEGLLCRQYLGWKQDDQRLISGSAYLVDNPIRWRDPNLYYWYYATQVLHHMKGRPWEEWNSRLRVELPKRQASVGAERGSWYHPEDRWTEVGGRLYSTCMCTFMLEVYYRHLPIYNPMFQQ